MPFPLCRKQRGFLLSSYYLMRSHEWAPKSLQMFETRQFHLQIKIVVCLVSYILVCIFLKKNLYLFVKGKSKWTKVTRNETFRVQEVKNKSKLPPNPREAENNTRVCLRWVTESLFCSFSTLSLGNTYRKNWTKASPTIVLWKHTTEESTNKVAAS